MHQRNLMTKNMFVSTMRISTAPFLLLLPAALAAAAEEECGIYMATSSTSDSDTPKWGLYAGTALTKGTPVGPPDIAIQTHNLMGNAHVKEKDSKRIEVRTVGLFEEYIWVADSTAGKRELEGHGRIVSAIPGAGVLGGFNEKLTNTDWDHGGAYHKTPLGEKKGAAHVGRGASSQFYNVTLRAKEDVVVGAEIFLDYGEHWVSSFVCIVCCIVCCYMA